MNANEVAVAYLSLPAADRELIEQLLRRLSAREPTGRRSVRERLEAVAARCEKVGDLGQAGSYLLGYELGTRVAPSTVAEILREVQQKIQAGGGAQDGWPVVVNLRRDFWWPGSEWDQLLTELSLGDLGWPGMELTIERDTGMGMLEGLRASQQAV